MSQIFGSLRPDATRGEQTVLDLAKTLPDTFFVWPELNVREQHPDFVFLNPELGLAVIEVKDWVEIVRATRNTFTVRTRAGEERNEANPLIGARNKAITIANRLQERPRLRYADGPYRGKLKVPWSYAVVLPNLTRMFVYQLGDVAEPRYVMCQDDLRSDAFEDWLRALDFPYQAELTSTDIDEVRAGLDPVLRVVRPSDGAELGVADTQQEQIAKEGLHGAPAQAPEDELTPEGERCRYPDRRSACTRCRRQWQDAGIRHARSLLGATVSGSAYPGGYVQQGAHARPGAPPGRLWRQPHRHEFPLAMRGSDAAD